LSYQTRIPGNGLYVHVASGEVKLNGHTLGYGDAVGLEGVTDITLEAQQTADVLVFEVPMVAPWQSASR
jgi:redox-sensitive bicupin YhaK (pirin superfamily)